MSDKLPLITVFILLYKNDQELDKMVETVSRQSYPLIELVISDDGSPVFDQEKAYHLLEQYKGRFASTTINRNQINLGTVKHLNSIIPRAHGEIFCMLGGGDLYADKDVLKDVVQYISNADALLCTTKRIEWYGKKNVVLPEKRLYEIMNKEKRFLDAMCVYGNFISGAGTFYTRKLFEKYGLFDETYRLLEDYPYYLSLLFKGVNVPFFNRITVIHERGGVSDQKKHAPQLDQDAKHLLPELIYPNRDKLGKWAERVETFHYKFEQTNQILQKIWECVKYPDVIIYRVILHFLRMKGIYI